MTAVARDLGFGELGPGSTSGGRGMPSIVRFRPRHAALAAKTAHSAEAAGPAGPAASGAQAIGYGQALNLQVLLSGLTDSGSNRAASLSDVENVCCIMIGASARCQVARLMVGVADGVADLMVDQILPVRPDVTLERHRTAHPAGPG